jgi:hypothetical protein
MAAFNKLRGMTEIRIVEVYGIKIDVRAAALLETVMQFGGSGNNHQRSQADSALEKLGEIGATLALQHVVKEFSGSGNNHCRQLATRALELI